jgi:hypothetical protein
MTMSEETTGDNGTHGAPDGYRWVTVRTRGGGAHPVLICVKKSRCQTHRVAAGMEGRHNGRHLSEIHAAKKPHKSARQLGIPYEHISRRHNAHSRRWQEYSGVDTRVLGTPKQDAGEWTAVLANPPERLRQRVRETGGETDNGGFIFEDETGHLVYAGGAGKSYRDFADGMAEDIVETTLGDEHRARTDAEYQRREEMERIRFEDDLYRERKRYIQGQGGVAAPRKLHGATRDPRHSDEYRYLPRWAKGRGLPADEMAAHMARDWPELGIETEDDFNEWAMAQDRAARDRARMLTALKAQQAEDRGGGPRVYLHHPSARRAA